MKCKKVCDLLKSCYLDGELSGELRAEIERHLKHCPACRLLRDELVAQQLALRGLEEQKVPAEIWQNIQNKILERQPKPQKNIFIPAWEGLRAFFYPPRPAFVLASALTVFIIALFAGKLFFNQRLTLKTTGGDDFFADYQLNGFAEVYSFDTEIEEYFL